MRKFLSLSLVVLIATFMFSCGGGSSSDPKAVAEDFLKALATQDYDSAKELGTEQTVQMLSMIEGMISMMPKDQVEKDKENIKTLKMGEVKIDGDNAVVYYDTAKESGQKIELKKVDGDWKVDMKKDM